MLGGALSEPPQDLRPATSNPVLMQQFANQRAANPRPDVTYMGHPSWDAYWQNAQRNIQQNWPIDSPEAVRQAAFQSAMNVGPLMTKMPDMGKVYDAYHGTKSAVDSFDLRKAGKSDPGLFGRAVYLTPSAEQASSFAMSPHYGKGDAPNVMPLRVSLKNPLVVRDGVLPDGRSLSQLHPNGISKESAEAAKNWALKQGYDGVVFEAGGEVVQIAAFNPQSVVSKFQK